MKLSISDVEPIVAKYYSQLGNESGGNFHIVLEDRNIKDWHIHACLDAALAAQDYLGMLLGLALLGLSKTQRLKLTY